MNTLDSTFRKTTPNGVLSQFLHTLRKAVCLLLVAATVPAVAQTTISVTPNYAAETMTVTVSNPPASGDYVLVYTYSNTDAAPDAPTVGNADFDGEYSGSPTVALTNYSGTLAVGNDWTKVTFAFMTWSVDNSNSENPVVTGAVVASHTEIVYRYAAPLVGTDAAHRNLVMTDGSNANNTRIEYYRNGVVPLVLAYETSGDVRSKTFVTDVDVRPFSNYHFRTVGPEAGAWAAYPSVYVDASTQCYYRPVLNNYSSYRAATSTQEMRPFTGAVVSGAIGEAANAKIYINYKKYITGTSGELKDPNPYDTSTYNIALPSGTALTTIIGSNTGLPMPTFKMVAGPMALDASTNLLTSPVTVVDEDYSNYEVICHKNGNVLYYLSFDPETHSFVSTPYIDVNCLWVRNPVNNHIYHVMGSTRYCLGVDNGNVLTVHNSELASDTWFHVGKTLNLMGDDGYQLAYRNGQWMLVNDGTPAEVDVLYRVNHREVDPSTYYAFDHINVGKILVPQSQTIGEYDPNWLALDQNRSWTVQVKPTIQINKYDLPEHDYLSFTDPDNVLREIWHYYGSLYRPITAIPNRMTTETSIQPTDSRYTYTWTVYEADGTTPSQLITVTPVANTNGSRVTLQRANSDPIGLNRLVLKVEVSYRDETSNSNGDVVMGSAAAPATLPLFAEHTVAATDLTSVPNSIEPTPPALRTPSGSYLLRNMPTPDSTHLPYFDITADHEDGDSPCAILTAVPDPERLLEVHYTYNSSTGQNEISITNPALAAEHGLTNTQAYHLVPADGQQSWAYLPSVPALRFTAGGNSDDYRFTITAYAGGDASTPGYFTFRPHDAPSEISVEPQMGLRAEGMGLRYVNSTTSRSTAREEAVYRNINVNGFYASRWQLVDPTLIKPDIEMTPDGVVTVTDRAGHLRHVYGTLHVQYKHANDAEWTTVPDFTLDENGDNFLVIKDNNNNPIQFGVGDQVKAWKTSGTDHSYFAPSADSLFIVRKTPTPTVSVSTAEGHAHDILFTARGAADATTHDTLISCKGQRFSFSTYATPAPTADNLHPAAVWSDWSNWSTTATLSNHYYPDTLKVRAVAPNCLASDPTAEYYYKPKLMIGVPPYVQLSSDSYDVIVYSGVPSTEEYAFMEWIMGTSYFPNSTDYTVHYTTDGSEVTPASPQCAISSFDYTEYNDYNTYYTVPIPDGYGFIRVKAFPVEGKPYVASDEFEYLFHATEYTICDTIHPEATGSDYHFYSLLANAGSGNADNNIVEAKDHLDATFIWHGNSSERQNSAIRNKMTGKYLTLTRLTSTDANTNTTTTTLSLTAEVSRNDGHRVSDDGTTQIDVSTTWLWSGETATDEADRHRLYTDIGTTRYYLAIDRAAATAQNPSGYWKVVTDAELDDLLDGCTTRTQYNPNICFRTEPSNYRGGADFDAMSAQLQVEMPVGSGHWTDIADANSHGWLSLAQGDSAHVRAVFTGDSIVYTPNTVIYIVRPGHDNNVDPSDFDHYIPWQFWLLFDDGTYSQQPRHVQHIVDNHFDSLSVAEWFFGSASLGEGGTVSTSFPGFPDNPGATYAEATSSAQGRINDLFQWKHVRGRNYLTIINDPQNGAGVNNMPDCRTLIQVRAKQSSVYTAGIADLAESFDNTLHLFAEKVDRRTSSTNGEGQWPQFAGGKRWRLLSKDYDEATGQYHYLTADHHSTTRVDATRYPYLANQPRMTTLPDYTHYAVWMLTSEDVGTTSNPLYRVTIKPVEAQQKHLVHLPGNGLDASGTDRGDNLYKRGEEPVRPAGVDAEHWANGVFLHDPTSIEDYEYEGRAYHELYRHYEDFLHFAIRQYEETDGTGAATAQYVTLSPFYRGTVGNRTANIASYLSLANNDGEDQWQYVNFGQVPFGQSDNATTCFTAARNDFLHTRWHLDQAKLTPPYVEMNPSGVVTLWHRLERVNEHGSSEYIADLNQKLLYYYVINRAADDGTPVADANLVYPTFNTSYVTGPNDDLEPSPSFTYDNRIAAINASTNTQLYDPNNKPVLHKGDKITVRAVLLDALQTTSFNYTSHISRPHIFEAEQSTKPAWVDATTKTEVSFDADGGDTLLIGQDMADVNYAIYTGEGGNQVYGIRTATSTPDMLRDATSTIPYVLRAFQHNKLESEPLYFYQNVKLRMVNVTVSAVDATTHKATIQLQTETEDGRVPLPDYYNIYYTTKTPGSDGIVPETVDGVPQWQEAHTHIDDRDLNGYKIEIEVRNGTTPTAFPLRIQARRIVNDFYNNSDVFLTFLIHPNYTGGELETVHATTTDANGNPIPTPGTQANPYKIATPFDLFSAANLINSTEGYASAWYRVTNDIDMQDNTVLSSMGASSTSSNRKFSGHWDGGYHTISGLTKPLFDIVDGGHIYNVVVDNSQIVGSGDYTGGLVNLAQGDARIYNSGIRSTGQSSSTVTGTQVTGGLVGKLDGTARLVNCYNFANVKSNGSTAAGLVGYSTAASTITAQNNIVFNSINYGNVASAGTNNVYPVQGGGLTSNITRVKNIPTYTYYNSVATYTPKAKLQSNDALGAEERFLTTYEFVRYVFNANLKKAGWWVLAPTADYTDETNNPGGGYHRDKIPEDSTVMGVWVLDKRIAPYPIIKPKYDITVTTANGAVTNVSYTVKRYRSIINPDHEAGNNWRANAKPYQGRVLTGWGNNGMLTVHVQGATTKDTTIAITDMDTLNNDYNYAKIQLPYYQDLYGLGSNIAPGKGESGNTHIVTGWKITQVKRKEGENTVSYTNANITTDTVVNYNFADRTSVVKDIWDTNKNNLRIFAQGGYYNVPYGVTEITIQPKWARAIYIYEAYNDAYTDNYASSNAYPGAVQYGSTVYSTACGKTLPETSIKLVTSKSNYAGQQINCTSTVYDRALVLLSDLHNNQLTPFSYTNKKFTVMTLDEDNDHEPDHVLYHYANARATTGPIRYDFIAYTELGFWRTQSDGTVGDQQIKQLGIPMPTGHYEITETAMARFGQFEYEATANGSRSNAPMILNGGVFDQFVTHHNNANNTYANGTNYMQLGGHVYFKLYQQGTHPDYPNKSKTKHCPVSVTGGLYDDFYMTGYLCPSDKYYENNHIYLYASGGRIGHFASGANELIDGNVTVKADHLVVNDFYGGGINADKAITGDINITLDSSIVYGIYAGGNKFGNMGDGKKVTTNATGTTFYGDYYGAGYGGTSLARTGSYIDGPRDPGKFRFNDINSTGNNTKRYAKGYYTTDCGDPEKCTGDVSGICVDYEFELLTYSSSKQMVDRYYVLKASLSKAQSKEVESTLKGCVVKGNYYGGGYVGKVDGTAKSTLEDCIVEGGVFAGGNKSELPKVKIYPAPTDANYPSYDGGAFNFPAKPTPDEYTWVYDGDVTFTVGTQYIDETAKTITTDFDLSDVGVCTKTDLTLKGNTVVYGSVYGGGNEAETGDPNVRDDDDHKPDHYTEVLIKDNVYVMGDVVAAGHKGKLTGSSSLTIGTADGDTAVSKVPWVDGDVYGGAYSADVDGYSNITIYDGVLGPVYGGGYTGSVYKNSNVKVLGGWIGYRKDTVTVENTNNKIVVARAHSHPVGPYNSYYGVFGAGFGYGTSVGKDATVTIGSSATSGDDVQHNHIHIYGSVFGGGEAGQVGTGFEIYHGSPVPAGYWYVDGEAGTFRKLTEAEDNEPRNEHSFYAQFYLPTYGTTTVSIQAPDKAENSLTTNIDGAVFGGGRGYYFMEDEEHPGTYKSTLNTFKLSIAGAVYGNTKVTIGTEDQKEKENGIHIGSVDYYTDMETAAKYRLIDFDRMSNAAVFWDDAMYVYDMDSLDYKQLDPNSRTVHNVKTRSGQMPLGLWTDDNIDGVLFYLNLGAASVVGGGEMGPVYGDSIFTVGRKTNGELDKTDLKSFNADSLRWKTSSNTGNTEVTIYSGTIGNIRNGKVEGRVFGGGLEANVDGTCTVTIDGTHAWVRGDAYPGGCLGTVYGYHREDDSHDAVVTTQYLRRGWARNAYGGSCLADHGKGCNTKLVVGFAEETDNKNLLVSESVYGANAYSSSKGSAELEMYSGSIGFVLPNTPINVYKTGLKDRNGADSTYSDEVFKEGVTTPVLGVTTPVLNEQELLGYEGDVYGAGFGPMAHVKSTKVTIHGGNIRNGVFGGGEVSPVIQLAEEGTEYNATDTSTYLYVCADVDGLDLDTVPVRYVKPDPTTTPYSADVTVNGGQMGMVVGGGRGYTYFMDAKTNVPGIVVGNTRVTITGGKVGSTFHDTTYFSADLGGGNVYGGGLEGEVTGNTEVTISGNAQIQGRAFAGGRGYRDAMLGTMHTDDDQMIYDRATATAGAVHGNTAITVTGNKNAPVVGSGVYGGGEGMNYYWAAASRYDTVATVYGNATVDISGGKLGGGYKNVGKNQQQNEIVDNGSYAGGRIASVYGTAKVHVYGDANVAALYGGNDISGKVYGKGGYNFPSVHNATSGANLGDSTETYVLVDATPKSGTTTPGAPRIGRLFGGGNGYYPGYYQKDDAGRPLPGASFQLEYLHVTPPVQEKTYLDINLGAATLTANPSPLTDTTSYIASVFGGGNQAKVVDATVMLHNMGLVDTLFAGGNSATVTRSATVKTYATGAINELAEGHNVGILFGGNNQADMNIIPTLDLQSGVFDRVFGGGNAGAMTAGSPEERDILGELIPNRVSTRVIVNSSNVTVRNALYGGCNQADVRGGTYVAVLQTSDATSNSQADSTYGINRLFGGNDISAHVANARVDVIGGVVHNIFGGGNGYYYYVDIPGGATAADFDDHTRVVSNHNSGRPTVGDAHVNIWGGKINSHVYGGGYAGNCENTHVVVDDRVQIGENASSAIIGGRIYGGGRGILDYALAADRHPVGNVTGRAVTDLKHVTTLKEGDTYAYGGGYGGDVRTTLITMYPEWNKDLTALYGGCYGSNVLDTALVVLNPEADEENLNKYNVTHVYGGNDYSGNVNHSHLTINSGRYEKVFGAGNGAYGTVNADGVYTSSPSSPSGPSNTSGTSSTSVPNSQYPVVDIYGGEFVQNVYGGGNLGTCKVNTTSGEHTNLSDYALVQVNIHGGSFHNDIFAGAAGQSGMNPLINGLKVLNMDGGVVTNSVYGGTESVNDGYPSECVSKTNTTLRPSSILNLVGGDIGNNVYGGGYLGQVYGSVYVNVGKEAVDSCRAYNRTYGTSNHNYAVHPYKPLFVTGNQAHNGDTLKPAELILRASIYAGANWGSGNTNYTFNTPGFFGGESRIRIDGEGYNTTTSSTSGGTLNDLPGMGVRYSLIGAGTSCEGGDVLRDIRVLNYGVWESGGNCQASKDIWSIQRADSVVFKHVGLVLTGDQDAYSAYPSSKFAMTRCGKVVFEDKNVLELEKPAVKIGELAFRANTIHLRDEGKGAEMKGDSLTAMRSFLTANASCGTNNTGTSITSELCESVTPLVSNAANRYSTLLVDNGAYIDVYDTTGHNGTVQYGAVLGYGFLRAQNATQAIVTARAKTTTVNTTDGGFFGVCPNDPGFGEGQTNGTSEFYYGNNGTTANSYRAWKFGKGTRMRQVTVVAHTDTAALPNNYGLLVDTSQITYNNNGAVLVENGNTGSVKLGLVKVPLELPPTDPGNYYVIDGGITVDQENRELELVGGAFIPNATNGVITITNNVSNASAGTWISASNGVTLQPAQVTEMVRAITGDASHKFGLAIGAGGLFTNTQPTLPSGSTVQSNPGCRTAIASGTFFEVTNGYATTTVDGTSSTNNVVPTLNVYLTYDGRFTTTLMGDVTFTLKEMTPGQTEPVGTIDVTISISTILTEFKDQKYELVAMKNGFDNHVYSRKLILPASMRRRSLYLTDLEWEPTVAKTTAGQKDTTGTAANFGLTTAQNAIVNRSTLGQNTFGLVVRPTEDLSNTTTTTLGWYRMMEGDSLDLRKEYDNDITRVSYSVGNAEGPADRKKHYSDNNGKGKLIGVLDGRSSAAIDMSLYYNGDQMYENDEGVRGRAVLHFAYYNQNTSTSNAYDDGNAGVFRDTIYIRTRKAGDTIYLCSEPSITRDNITIYPHGGIPSNTNNLGHDDHHHYADDWEQLDIKKGKNPRQYVTSFEDALDHKIYKAGDVIYIIGPVDIKGRKSLNIHGYEYNFVPVMRYPGSHFMFPGDTCAYRGPLVRVSEEGKFSTEYVFFDGNMVSSRKAIMKTGFPTDNTDKQKVVRVEEGQNVDYYAWGDEAAHPGSGWKQDTIAATAPLFEVKDAGVLTLGHKSIIRNSWNKTTVATATEFPGSVAIIHQPSDTYVLGGETIPAHPRMVVTKDVEIYNNMVGTSGGSIPTGAIHLKEGTFQLGSAINDLNNPARNTKVLIEKNYEANGTFWTTGTTGNTKWQVSIPTTFKKANVYLHHERFNNSETEDAVSRMVTFADEQSASSRIGISKEFPGLTVRDTMIIAQVTNGYPTYAANAKANGIFFNDNRIASSQGANVFYHTSIAPTTIFFQRCATFQKQLYEDASHVKQVLYSYVEAHGEGTADDETINIMQEPVLSYRWNNLSSCPNGTDTVIYRVHGGFYPYTYTWSDLNTNTDLAKKSATPYSNAVVNEAMAVHNYQPALLSNRDTLVLRNITSAGTAAPTAYQYSVTATDIAGCTQTKKFTVNVQRIAEGTSSLTLDDPVSDSDYDWGDTTKTHTETALRKHKGLKLLVKVMPEEGYGTVTGSLETTSVNLGTPYVGGEPNTANASLLCSGDAITLKAIPASNKSFIQWDFDPYDVPNTVFVMPSNSGMPGTDANVIKLHAFFAPQGYWKDHVRSAPSVAEGFETKYWGSVHIRSKEALAWLISLANGYNDQAPHDFYFDTIFIHATTGGANPQTVNYDMVDYLWTPLGTSLHKFKGRLMVDEGVKIQNIIVDEPNMDYVGFFGHTENAVIENLHINNSVFHGGQYVGGITADSKNDVITNSSVTNHSPEDATSAGYGENAISVGGDDYTIITTTYCSGGLVGTAEGTTIQNCEARARYMGAAIYNGGIGGWVKDVTGINCAVRSMPRMSSLYSGGIFGYSTASSSGSSKSNNGTRIVNNYVAFGNSDGSLTRAGGLVGYAKNTTMANNYVYGENKGASISGAIGSTIDDGVHIENCFFEQGFDRQAFGFHFLLDTSAVTSFHKNGTRVLLTDTLGNNTDLLRQLNRWVYAHGDGSLHYWHSDTSEVNKGYPVFGDPEYLSVHETRDIATCDSLAMAGLQFTTSGTYHFHVVDSAEFTDTAVTLYLTINYSELTEFGDSIRRGEGYEGHGFYLTAKEIELMMQTLQEEGAVTVVVSDTLQTLAGCDSIVTLYLTVGSALSTPNVQHVTLKVYPNPTTKNVTVEADGLQTVELYDAVSRKLQSTDTFTHSHTNTLTLDLDGLPAGAYYLRIRTDNGTVIKKVIKR